jgi:hypothetical protein
MSAGQQLQQAGNRSAAGSRRQAVMIPSALDEAALAVMRADAAAKASPFTDPALLRKAELALAGVDAAWLGRVIGHPARSWRYLSHAEMLLAVRAAETDAEHLAALAEAEHEQLARERQAAAAAAQAKAEAAAEQWQRLREQLPVPVTVQHNWTARHLDGYEQGADHIIVLEDLDAGRLRRAAGTPLCQTPSRARQQRHVSGSPGDERRLPDCTACLHHAEKLAATLQTGGIAEPAADGPAAAPGSSTRQDPPWSASPGGRARGAASGGGTGPPGKAAASSPDGDDDDDEAPARAQITGRQLREAAHRYLEDGLLPVPAWAARPNGGCCCPRGAGCSRPGKHPRSVPAGPGPGAWSWKPLACRTHAEIEQRFALGGQYAAGNLMVAIPKGMMAIDRDDDDGGRAAVIDLAEELGELPPTLAHKTPHGEHLIYRTPPGWKGRAWVGKDPANPVPAGIDLRMPGQILMAAPSVVPGPDGPARYGPLTGNQVAALPAAYVTAWTPPQPQSRPAGRRVPIPPDSAGRAARYVHEAMTRIAEDLASRQPGGRNAAAYTAGLKAGSLLGAARATPGAGQAAAAWTDEQAEQALMDAAERNGYTGKDGPAQARRAIRSGLRNGLRNPRALPDFTTTTRPAADRQQAPYRHPPSSPARAQRAQAADARRVRAGRWQDMVPGDIRRQIEAADKAASGGRRAAIAAHQQALDQHNRSATQDTAAEVERTRAAARAAHQAYTHDGRHITGRHDAAMLRWAASIIAQREQHAASPALGQQDTRRMQANRAAVAANQAYKAGHLDQARQLTEQAAALDPSRAWLWQQHRQQITARRLILDARAAHAEADHRRAQQILAQPRQLDPRMPAIWDGDLPAVPPAPRAQRGRDVPPQGPGGTGTAVRAAQAPGPQHRPPGTTAEGDSRTPQPSWPSSPTRRDQGPAATASPQADGTPPAGQRPAAATPRESRPCAAHAATGDPDAGTELPGNGHPPWPSPGPRSEPQAASPPRQASREARTGAATRAEASGKRDPRAQDAAPSADWRDDIISAAREAWQPGPSWPDNPALRRPAEAGTLEAGIEPGEPHA